MPGRAKAEPYWVPLSASLSAPRAASPLLSSHSRGSAARGSALESPHPQGMLRLSPKGNV